MFYARAYKFEDIRKMMAENLAEEEGFKAIPRQGHEPHGHNELMFRFCRAAGLSDAEVRDMKMTPAWWARSLYYYNTAVVEPIGVVLAMQTTQESQMPELIGEVLLPSRNTMGSSEPRERSSSSPNTTRPMSSTAVGRASSAPNTWTPRSSRRALSRSPRRSASCVGRQSPTSSGRKCSARKRFCRRE